MNQSNRIIFSIIAVICMVTVYGADFHPGAAAGLTSHQRGGQYYAYPYTYQAAPVLTVVQKILKAASVAILE